MDQSKLRAWWAYRQGLDGSMAGKSTAEILGRIGWARSVGGVGPYLTLFSRAGLSRESVDADVATRRTPNISDALLAGGFARAYDGGHRSGWCASR